MFDFLFLSLLQRYKDYFILQILRLIFKPNHTFFAKSLHYSIINHIFAISQVAIYSII